MKRITQTVIFSILILLLNSCEKKEIELDKSFENQRILFQKEYINYAWGYYHNGWFVDTLGSIYSYSSPKNWNENDSLGNIYYAQIEENLSHTQLSTIKVDLSILTKNALLIEEASTGKIKQTNLVMFDAGATAYYCYKFNPTEKSYHRFLLKQIGDINLNNESEAANNLYIWLNEIDNQIQKLNK